MNLTPNARTPMRCLSAIPAPSHDIRRLHNTQSFPFYTTSLQRTALLTKYRRQFVYQNMSSLKYANFFMYAEMFQRQVNLIVIKYVKFRRFKDHTSSSGIACKKKHINSYDTNGIIKTHLPTVLR
jgi:hypothetical protein